MNGPLNGTLAIAELIGIDLDASATLRVLSHFCWKKAVPRMFSQPG